MLTISKASAGAGKTFLLTKTYIDMLFSAHNAKNAHRRILAVTFTKKATAEMKHRIVKELSVLAKLKQESEVENKERSPFATDLKKKYRLSDAQVQQQAQQILFDLLQDYGAFAVSTIDSFFQQVIRAFSRELGLAGKYNVELDTPTIQQTAVDDFFHSLSPKDDKLTFGALLRLIEERLQAGKPWDPKEDLLSLSSELFQEAVMLHQQELFAFLENDENVKAYRDQLYAKRQAFLSDYARIVHEAKAYMQENGLTYADFSRGATVFAPLNFGLVDMIKASTAMTATFENYVNGGSVLRKADQKNVALLQHEAMLRGWMQALYAMLRGERMRELITIHAILDNFSYMTLLGKVAQQIELKNKELNRLPISDTNAILHNVIAANTASPFVYEKIGTRIRHFLIDEFQDTSAMQWANFCPLIDESLATKNANLVVGDVKQSIYRFRNSDYSLMLTHLDRAFAGRSTHNDLEDNWRSSQSVVDFNNRLFGPLTEALSSEFTMLLDGRYTHLQQVLSEVYTQHGQDPKWAKKEKVEGYVQVAFSPFTTKREWREGVLKQLPELIADLQRRQFALGRVACLVRNNRDALSIAATLVNAGYQVMSNEGLLLNASPAVQFVILFLKTQLHPEDAVLQYELRYIAEQLGVRGEQMASIRTEGDSLLEQVQTIIHISGLGEQAASYPYLLALQDKVYDYINSHSTDLYAFLTWWDANADSFALAMQQTDDAIQIVSIHKSKGLEYDVVIVPFCDWDKSVRSRGRTEQLLWVVPHDELAEQYKVPLVPVKFDKSLAQSDFAEAYYEELMNLYLDNLNLTYVTFTRAKHELYVFAPACEEKKEPKTMGAQLHAILQNNACGMTLCETDSAATYTLGTQTVYVPDAKKDDEERIEKMNMWEMNQAVKAQVKAQKEKAKAEAEAKGEEANENGGQLRLRLPSREFFSKENDAQTLGVLVHQILQQVNVRGDEERVIAEMLRQGILQQSQLPIIQKQMQQFWEVIDREGRSDWFDANRYTILNEQDILLTTGQTERPDRILIDSITQHAVIIDYKTGREYKKKYAEQVQGYMQYLQQMGYTVEGYLCYISLGKIVPVVCKA